MEFSSEMLGMMLIILSSSCRSQFFFLELAVYFYAVQLNGELSFLSQRIETWRSYRLLVYMTLALDRFDCVFQSRL